MTRTAILLLLSAFVSISLADLAKVPQDPKQVGKSPATPAKTATDNSDGGLNEVGVDIASVFGAGCRWDPTKSNIEQVSFDFTTGQAPPSDWYSNIHQASADQAKTDSKLTRRDASQKEPQTTDPQGQKPVGGQTEPGPTKPAPAVGGKGKGNAILDASYHSGLIDVLTYRAKYGYFGSSLNSAGCALPAFSERLARLEQKECDIINAYNAEHAQNMTPSAMYFWAGLSNYDRNVKSDLIQTAIFYGDGCAADPERGMCIYAAEYSNFRYDAESHMCMGSNLPVFYPAGTPMTVIYRTQRGFRSQEAWINGKMISYLRSAGDQIMNSFVITQECKGCVWPRTEQRYTNIRIKFTQPEENFADLGLCTGGARLTSLPKPSPDNKIWTIDEVIVPAGRVTEDGHGNSADTATPAAATV